MKSYNQYLYEQLLYILSKLKNRKLRKILLSYKPFLEEASKKSEVITQPLIEHYLFQALFLINKQDLKSIF